jgi:hypothetical protein
VWAKAECVAPHAIFFQRGHPSLTIKQSALNGKCELTGSCSKTRSVKEWVMSVNYGEYLQ